MNRQMIVTLSGCGLLLLVFFFPWQQTVYAPGLLRAEQQGNLYMPLPAKIEQIKVSPGQQVAKGDVLYVLHTDALVHQGNQLALQLQTLGWQQDYQTLNRQTLQTHQRIRKEREAAILHQQVISGQRDDLLVRSPIAGRIADAAEPLNPGEWLAQGEWLATVVSPDGALVEAFVREKDWLRLSLGAKGTFYSKQSSLPGQQGEVVEIEQTAVRDLSSVAELASVYGGDIASLTNQQREIIPEQAVYRVLFRLSPETSAPFQVQPGTLALEGQSQILAVSLWKYLSAVVIRELAF